MDTVLVTGGRGTWQGYRPSAQGLIPRTRAGSVAGSDPDVEWIRGDLATGEGIAKRSRAARR